MSSEASLWITGLGALLVIVGTQVFMSTRKQMVVGCIMPVLFLGLAGYNLYKSLYVYNPYPTMAEGMFMTLGLAGFAVSLMTLIICRVSMKYKRSSEQP